MPHLEDELKKAEEQVHGQEPASEQLARLRERLAAAQEALTKAQADMGHRTELSQQMSALAQKMKDMRRIQETVGEEQDKASDQAEHMLNQLLDDAIRNGQARPCDPAY
jgi:flagellar biosynthesis component FlhA